MPRNNRTIRRDSVLRPTATPGLSPPPAQQGIPAPAPATRQTALWLADAELEWLDDRVRDVRQGGWRGITRSALLRALIRTAMEKDVALNGVTGEGELVEQFKQALSA
jgi:hypothetical protein